MRLTWKPGHVCGHAAIDREHVELLYLANELLDLVLHKDMGHPPRFNQALDQLLGKVMSPGSQITSNSTRRCVSSAESSHVSLRQLTGFLTYELLARHIAGRT